MATYQTTASISAVDFKAKWQNVPFNEQQAAAEFFCDLCRMLGHVTPGEYGDPENFTLEKRVLAGRADAYKAGCFGWEFKGHKTKFPEAFNQLLQYQVYLRTPPLLVVSSFDIIRVQTNFRDLETVTHDISVADIDQPQNLSILRNLFHDPDRLRPERTIANVTQETARLFSTIATDLEKQTPQPAPAEVARFLNRLTFCLYAQAANLLPENTMSRILRNFYKEPEKFDETIADLFGKMAHGGIFGPEEVKHFNGDLFTDAATIKMTTTALERLAEASRQSWRDIAPSIFGALFERVLDAGERHKLGAHYTGEDKIMMVIDPTLVQPLRREWEQALDNAQQLIQADAEQEACDVVERFRQRLGSVKALDPACGSGNFLYVAMKAMLDLEKEAILFLAEHGQSDVAPVVSPRQMLGIEINPYAAELARTSLRIGYIQWHQANGFEYSKEPVLETLDTIRQADALLEPDDKGGYRIPQWPAADYIVGNPAFLGAGRMLSALGDKYAANLRQAYRGRVDKSADLCCYWFENARRMIAEGKAKRAGLLATNAIRYGSSRETLRRIRQTGNIFAAYDDEVWKPDEKGSAAVQVSIVCFDNGSETGRTLNDRPATDIDARLMDDVHLDRASSLPANEGVCFTGIDKGGKFELTPDQAKPMLAASNPNGRANSDVIARYLIGRDLNGKPEERWLIDFGAMPQADAMRYEQPYEYLVKNVQSERQNNREAKLRTHWWRHRRSGEDVKSAIASLPRYIATSQVSKHRFFQFVPTAVKPDGTIVVIASDDDCVLGMLESRFHKVWAAAMGTQLESRPRYIISECFDKFPFPEPDDAQRQAIAAAARSLDEQRQNACMPEGRFLRSMTDLYNNRPQWLRSAHRRLDETVAAAYGWNVDQDDNDLLQRLVSLNIAEGQAG